MMVDAVVGEYDDVFVTVIFVIIAHIFEKKKNIVVKIATVSLFDCSSAHNLYWHRFTSVMEHGTNTNNKSQYTRLRQILNCRTYNLSWCAKLCL